MNGQKHLMKRAYAYLIDLSLVIIINKLIMFTLILETKDIFSFLKMGRLMKVVHSENFNLYFNALLITSFLLYFTLSYYLTKKTIGKLLLGLEVEGKDRDLTFKESFLRPVGYLVCHYSFGLLFLIPFITKSAKGIPDWFSKTSVPEFQMDKAEPLELIREDSPPSTQIAA